ncbi:MAG: hypothetical protein R2685_10940 [Candidatus Nitrosocosmicus sp.]|nr:hypothetical protein [Candidatus Nitrosocosmicus sp.]
MSSNGGSTDQLRFQFFIEKKGDVTFINQLGTAIEQAFNRSAAATTKFGSTATNSMNQVNSSVGKTRLIFNEFGTVVASAARSGDGFASSMSKFTGALRSVDTSMQKGVRSMSDFTNFTKSAVQSAGQFDTSVRKVASSMNQGAANATRYSGIFKQIESSMKAASSTLTQNTTALTANTQKLEQQSMVMRNAIANTRNYATSLEGASAAMASYTTSAEASAAATRRQNAELIQNARHVSAVGLSFIMLTNTMSDSGLVAENIAMQQEKLTDLQEKYTEAVKKYGEEGFRTQQIQDQIAKAERGLAFERREQTAQLHNMIFIYALIGTELASSLIPALLNLEQTTQKVKAGWASFTTALESLPSKGAKIVDFMGGLGNALSAIPTRLRGTAQEVGVFSGAMAGMAPAVERNTKNLGALGNIQPVVAGGFRSMLLAAGPFLAVIGAVGVAIAAIATDFLGVRTSLEGFGASLGQAVPVLYPFLEGIQAIGAQLGITGESAEEAKTHMDNAGRGFANLSTLWNDTVANMQSSSNRMVKAMGDTAAVLGRDITVAAGKLDTQLKATADTWNQFVDALGRGDYKTATDLIISSFEAIPGIVGESITQLGTIVTNAFIGLGNTVGPAIVGIGKEFGARILEGIQSGLAGISGWVSTYLINPVVSTLTTLPSQIEGMGEQIVAGLLSGDYGSIVTNWLKGVGEALSNGAQSIADFFQKSSGHGETPQEIVPITGNTQGTPASAPTTPTTEGKSFSEYMDAVNQLQSQGYKRVRNKLTGEYNYPIIGSEDVSNEPLNLNKPVLDNGVLKNVGGKQPTVAQGPLLPKTKSPYEFTPSSNFIGGTPQITSSGQPSYAVGVKEATKAIVDEKAALKELQKSTDGTTASTASFLLAQSQIPKVFLDGGDAFTALDAGIGKLIETNNGLETSLQGTAIAMQYGYAQSESFKNGVLEQKTALNEANLENIKMSGGLLEMSNQLRDGSLQVASFNQGMLEQRKTGLESIAAIDKMKGGLQELNTQYESGVTEAVAFASGQIEASTAVIKMAESTANAIGNFTGFINILKEGKNAATFFNAGFASGVQDIQSWATGLMQSQGVLQGTYSALVEVGHELGVGLPSGFDSSIEGAKQWIGIMQGAPDVLTELVTAAGQAGEGIISGLGDALREGGDEFDDAVEELSKNLGFKFTDEMQDALQPQIVADSIRPGLEAGVGLLAKIPDLNSEGARQIVKGLTGQIQDSIEDSPELTTAGNTLIKMLANPPGAEATAQERMKWIATLQKAVTDYGEVLPGVTMSNDALNKSFGEGAGAVTNLANAYDNLGQKAKAYYDQISKQTAGFVQDPIKQQQYLEQNGNPYEGTYLGNQLQQNADNAKTATGPTATNPQQATIDTAVKSLDALNAKTAEVMAAMLAAVGTGMGQIATVTNTVFTQMMGLEADVFGKMIEVATTTFTAIGEAAGAMGPPLANVFGTVQAAFGTILGQMINTATSAFTAMGSAATGFTTGVQTNFAKAQSDAGTILGEMINTSTEAFGAMGESASAVSEGVDQYFGKAADDGMNLMDALERSVVGNMDAMASAAEKVADAIDSIGESAKSAESAVDSLRSAVESLPNVSRTITYHIKTVGSPPPGAAMGVPFAVNMAMGGQVSGQDKTVITGESGDEFVRIFDKFGQSKEQIVKDIKSFTLKAGEAIQVQPLQGYYGKRFEQKFGNIMNSFGSNIVNMAEGGTVTAPIGNNENGVPIYGGKPSGEYAYNANAEVTMEDGSKVRFLDWNNQSDEVRKERMNDITSVPQNYALYEDGSINRPPDWGKDTNSESKDGFDEGDSGAITSITNPKDHDIGSGSYLGSGEGQYYKGVTGYWMPDYVQSPGHGATSKGKWLNPNIDPRSWTAVQMQDDPKLWKVVDDKGVNIAAKFKSKAEAEEFIQEHIYAAYGNSGDVPDPSTDGPSSPTPGGSGGGTGGNGQNFQYQNGGLSYQYQNGKVTTNMTEEQIRIAEQAYGQPFPGHGGSNSGGGSGTQVIDPYNRSLTASQWGKSYLGNGQWYDPIYLNGGMPPANNTGQSIFNPTFPEGFPFENQPTGPNGGPVIGGIEFPKGFPFDKTPAPFSTTSNTSSYLGASNFTNVNGQNNNGTSTNIPSQNGTSFNNTPATGSIGAQQSQVVSQNSIVGQGNNSNIDYMSGTNSRLRIQNGQVIEATGIYAGYGNNGTGTGGGIGTGGSAKIRNIDLGPLNSSGIATSTPTSLYNNTTVKNDPTGVYDYNILPDPIFKEIPTRSLLSTGASAGGGSHSGGGSNPIGDLFDIKALLKAILGAIGNGNNLKINMDSEPFLNIVKGKIMDGYDNFK